MRRPPPYLQKECTDSFIYCLLRVCSLNINICFALFHNFRPPQTYFYLFFSLFRQSQLILVTLITLKLKTNMLIMTI